MSKAALKQQKAAEHGIALQNPIQMDSHRFIPKAQGGDYSPENFTIMIPTAHMRLHGNLREREEVFENMKAELDDHKQLTKLQLRIQNQLNAHKERGTDKLMADTRQRLEEQNNEVNRNLGKRQRSLKKVVINYAKYDKLAEAALNVPYVGPITVAGMLVYPDLGGVFPSDHPRAGQEKCPHASSMWKYIGIHTESWNRYVEGESSGGNKNLRTILYAGMLAQMQNRGPYRYLYDRQRVKRGKDTKQTWVWTSKKEGKWVRWCDAPKCKLHGDGIRVMMQHFSADWWFVGRDLMGLSNGPCYAEAQLGEGHRTIYPQEHGWVW